MAAKTMAYVTVMAVLVVVAAADTPVTAYTNHTVGGSAGWLFNTTTNTSSTNYTIWSAGQTFSLGDYLIFNTNTNQTVIQTYNETTYRNCTMDDDDSDGDTFQYGGGSNTYGQALTVAVPLTIEGIQYYFSSADDGAQCQRGMAFEIRVGRGLGLPPSLNQPPPPPYVEPPTVSEDGDTPQVTTLDRPSGVAVEVGANLRRVVSVFLCGALLLVL